MPRKPITSYAGGKGPRQLIWEAIRSLHVAESGPFTDDQIWCTMPRSGRFGVDISAVIDYRRCLVAAGILAVETPSVPRRTPATYILVKNEGLEAPRVRRDGARVTQGLAQEQMWRTLRMMTGDTNASELIAHASTPTIPVALPAAADYLLVLYHAGYLQRTAEGKGIGRGGIPARYRLLPNRNTGPRPPMVCRTKVVYDPNEDKVVWQPQISEEEAIYGR